MLGKFIEKSHANMHMNAVVSAGCNSSFMLLYLPSSLQCISESAHFIRLFMQTGNIMNKVD